MDVGDTLTSFEGRISSNETSLDTKQPRITDQSDIECMDIVADNIILQPPDLIGDIDITKGSISCTTITTGTVSALYKISTLTSMTVGTTLTVNSVDVGAKLVSLESKINSNTSNISSNTSSISGVATL